MNDICLKGDLFTYYLVLIKLFALHQQFSIDVCGHKSRYKIIECTTMKINVLERPYAPYLELLPTNIFLMKIGGNFLLSTEHLY